MARLERQTGLGTAAGGAIGAAGVVGGVGCRSTGSEAAGQTTSTDGKLATFVTISFDPCFRKRIKLIVRKVLRRRSPSQLT
jgi:hypothetical protein